MWTLEHSPSINHLLSHKKRPLLQSSNTSSLDNSGGQEVGRIDLLTNRIIRTFLSACVASLYSQQKPHINKEWKIHGRLQEMGKRPIDLVFHYLNCPGNIDRNSFNLSLTDPQELVTIHILCTLQPKVNLCPVLIKHRQQIELTAAGRPWVDKQPQVSCVRGEISMIQWQQEN